MRVIRQFLTGVVVGLGLVGSLAAQHRYSPEEYIYMYKDLAISEMKRSGIPASITIAQGLHESDNGNSYLAVSGNNHFGVKCHKWTGPALYKDDDRRNECFRKYPSAHESFRDHSDFILGGQRYSFLFGYKTTDYKSWAHGLKKAGYATNPQYPELIIKLIETYHLNELDKGGDIVHIAKKPNPEAASSSDFTIRMNQHPIHKRNDVEYIVVRKSDTFDKLCNEMEMFKWELLRYNELTSDSTLHEGQILYLQPKCRTAERGTENHIVLPGETVYSISQLYAVKMKHIRRLNRMKDNEEVTEGQVVYVWDKKPKDEVTK